MMGNTNTNTPLYRRKIDDQGRYLPFAGYTMVSNALHPLPKALLDAVDFLSSSELRNYYSFLPAKSYHVTINPLENVHDEHISLLHDEQRKLKERDTSMVGTAEKLARSKSIHIEIQLKSTHISVDSLVSAARSTELRDANVLHPHPMPWHLTLAYQYRDIEDDETKTRLDGIVNSVSVSSQFPFDLPLDHIHICRYEDLTQFLPI